LGSPIRSFDFAGECLGQHSGSDQQANLGDGHGYRTSLLPSPSPRFCLISSVFFLFQVNETAVIRLDYGDPTLGTCKETILGGNHFRYWAQTGSEANRFGAINRSSLDDAHFLPFFPYRFPSRKLFPYLVGLFLWPFLMNSRIHVSSSSWISPFVILTPISRNSISRHHL
jgi:hypothetical protein